MIFLIWFAVFVVVAYLYNREVYSRFRKHGVKNPPTVPLFGNMIPVITKKKHIAQDIEDTYYGFPEERFVGRFEFLNPSLIIRDLDLIKKVTVKDFEHFINHRSIVDKEMDPLFGRNLFSLKDQEWKDMRSALSPAFTSSKIRLMVPFMVEVGDMMIRSLKKQIKESGVDYVDVDCFDLTSRYTNDVIASCAFGLKVDSHTDKDNEFYRVGRLTTNTGFRKVFVFIGYSAFPWIMSKLGVRLFTDTTNNFFRTIILDTIKDREKKNIWRTDMIHLLMEARKGKLTYDEKASATEHTAGFATVEESEVGKSTISRDWSDDDLVAQAVLFFVAGFETVSTAMSYLLYEMACNPDVQDRLAKEVLEHDKKNGGKFDYNSIQTLTYMDMVISEILRKWPPAIGTDRLCVKDYNLGKPNKHAKEDFIMRKGESLGIPVWTIHHNPEFHPEPYKFDPERFSEENRHKINPLTYLPFGMGPRNCIGSRFALCELKVMTYQLIRNMEVSPCEKTQIPAELAAGTFNVRIKGGVFVRFKNRKITN